MNRLLILLFLLALAAMPAVAQDQEAPLNPDSPSLATSSTTVGKNRLYWEQSFQWQSPDGGPNSFTTPLLLRYGTSRDFELRLATNGYGVQGPLQGLNDFQVGFKAKLIPGDTSVGVIGAVQFPSGANVFRNNKVVPSLIVAVDQSAGDIALGFNLGGQTVTDPGSGKAIWQSIGTIDVGYNITDRLGVYGELATFTPASIGGPTISVVDGGFSYLLSSDVQVWAAYFHGLSGGFGDAVNFGTAARF